ncbi:MAG: porin [Gammaproteobacteria bacterium]|uniref:porin n=1 Tax=Pseudomaricurvus alcaniphilus TaxID=1166482 RepID=UPI001409221D|nr:porin [Pseudomaricurvus alcaniphilus]MBR9912400.1 porin [Gammaproteobacteria bacterium]NHN36767.1 porin [Pseudomaricurvus alcaniphilus]
MKKALLPLAIAALMPATVLAAGPIDGKVYGKVNVSVVQADDGDDSVWELNSNASRIGFSGKTQLNEDLSVIYKLEYETSVDDGEKDDQTFNQRNIYLGLTGGFGTLLAGKHDTPTKLAQNKIDLFNDLEGDIKNTFEGENRESNIVMYTTPELGGFAATLAVVASEGDDIDGDGQEDDGFDGTSIALSYTADSIYLALTNDQDIDGMDNLMRAVAQFNIADLQLGLMYQDAEKHNGYEEDGYFFSAQYTIGKVALNAQYGETEGDGNHEEETLSFGADYKLGKATKAFAFYTANEDNGADEDYFGIGLEHKF